MLGALWNVRNVQKNKHRWSERDARGYANAAVAPDAQPGPPSGVGFQPAASDRRGSGKLPTMRDTVSDGDGPWDLVPYAPAQEPSAAASLRKAVSVTPAATVSEDTGSDVVVRAAAPVPPASEVPEHSRGLRQSAAALGASLREAAHGASTQRVAQAKSVPHALTAEAGSAQLVLGQGAGRSTMLRTATSIAKDLTLGTPIPTAKDASAQLVAKFEPPVGAVGHMGRDVIALRDSNVVVRPTVLGTATAIAQDRRTLGTLTPIVEAGSTQLVRVPGPGVGGSIMLGTPIAKGRSMQREVRLVADTVDAKDIARRTLQLQNAVAAVLERPYVPPEVKAVVKEAVANVDLPGLPLVAENLQITAKRFTEEMMEYAKTSEAKLEDAIARLEKKTKKTSVNRLEQASALQRSLREKVQALETAPDADDPFEAQIAQVSDVLDSIDEFFAQISSQRSDRKRQQSKWAWLSTFLAVTVLVSASAYAMNQAGSAVSAGSTGPAVGPVGDVAFRMENYNRTTAPYMDPYTTPSTLNAPIYELDKPSLAQRAADGAYGALQYTGKTLLNSPRSAWNYLTGGSPPPTQPPSPAPAGDWYSQPTSAAVLDTGSTRQVSAVRTIFPPAALSQTPAAAGRSDVPSQPSPISSAFRSNVVSAARPIYSSAALPTQTGLPHFYSDNLTESL
jgi:hypothetical protein